MHSRIFQISRHPIIEDAYISQHRYYDSFVGDIADYVSNCDRSDSIQWLKSMLENMGVGVVDGDKMRIINKMNFFSGGFHQFKNIVEVLSNATITDFANNSLQSAIWELRSAYDDRYGFYFDDNGEEYGYQTFASFMRRVEDGDEFYIGAVTDYHC